MEKKKSSKEDRKAAGLGVRRREEGTILLNGVLLHISGASKRQEDDAFIMRNKGKNRALSLLGSGGERGNDKQGASAASSAGAGEES